MSNDLSGVEFATNPDPRAPLVLLLDTSGSMVGAPIDELNAGLRTLKEDLEKDELSRRRVEIAIVTFGHQGVTQVQDFVTVQDWDPPTLDADGLTPMGEALMLGLALTNERKSEYRANGIQYYRPWLFMLTDGNPTDSIEAAADLLRLEEENNGVRFFSVLVQDADPEPVASLSSQRPIPLRGLAFRELFQWLSTSQKRVSGSMVGAQVSLPPIEWSKA
ncbi:MAG: VWA domain-containing protein [Chloroflexi bacterium]|nr:VWA domain-containing protein [Chloroflexota bacterium]